jgi:hypothetical protein
MILAADLAYQETCSQFERFVGNVRCYLETALKDKTTSFALSEFQPSQKSPRFDFDFAGKYYSLRYSIHYQTHHEPVAKAALFSRTVADSTVYAPDSGRYLTIEKDGTLRTSDPPHSLHVDQSSAAAFGFLLLGPIALKSREANEPHKIARVRRGNPGS